MKIKNDVYKTDSYDNLRDMINKTTEKFSDKTAFIVKTKNENKINYRDVTFKEYSFNFFRIKKCEGSSMNSSP